MIGIKTLHWKPGLPCPTSPHGDIAWLGACLSAECLEQLRWQKTLTLPHSAPNENCTCGIYAVNSWFSLIDAGGCLDSPYAFTCVLDPLGKVIVHEKGWRAERVKVVGVGRAVCFCGHSDIPALHAAKHFGVPFLETQEIIDMLIADAYAREGFGPPRGWAQAAGGETLSYNPTHGSGV